MDRRKVILIAVAINTVLLILLFITALPHESETGVEGTRGYVLEHSSVFAEQPEPLTSLPVAETPRSHEEVEVVHQLPSQVTQSEPIVPIPSQNVLASAVPAGPPPVLGATAEVVVKKGDTLERIAKTHKTTIDEILRLNQLSSTFLHVGQILKMPAPKQKAESATTKDIDYYIVKVGDTPWTIAQKHQMRVDDLLKLNGLNNEKARRLKPGDRLKVR